MRRMALLSIVLAMLLGTAEQSWAQTATGQITGTIKDASGAVMAGAKVKVINERDGLDSRDHHKRYRRLCVSASAGRRLLHFGGAAGL